MLPGQGVRAVEAAGAGRGLAAVSGTPHESLNLTPLPRGTRPHSRAGDVSTALNEFCTCTLHSLKKFGEMIVLLRRRLLRAFVYALLSVVLASAAYAGSAQKLVFADPALEAAVRLAVEKPTGALTQGDVKGLKTLSAAAGGVTSLKGIEALVGLETLLLSYNQITDVAPLPS